MTHYMPYTVLKNFSLWDWYNYAKSWGVLLKQPQTKRNDHRVRYSGKAKRHFGRKVRRRQRISMTECYLVRNSRQKKLLKIGYTLDPILDFLTFPQSTRSDER